MENENEKLENMKNFPKELLIRKNCYIDILINNNWHQGFIKEEKLNNKYDILYLELPNKTLMKSNISGKGLIFFGHNYYQNNNNIRETYLNEIYKDLNDDELFNILIEKLNEINLDYENIEKIITRFEEKQDYNIITNFFKNENILNKENSKFIFKDENNNEYNITGFYTYQFFSGIFIDTLVHINNNLEEIKLELLKENKDLILKENTEKLLDLILNITIFCLILGLNNISKIKNYIQFNRLNIIINKTNSILSSLENIIPNIFIIFSYQFFKFPNIELKLKIICNLCYNIILYSYKENNSLPIQFLIFLINFITYEDNIIRIDNFDKNKVYKTFLMTIQNITENDIKYIKNFSQIYIDCKTIVKKLYKGEKKALINNCYYYFLINCLKKSNILEKKILALNCLNDIIKDLIDTENEINIIFIEFFINKNKIIDIFLEETVHDEILKRSKELFKYLSIYDMINDELIDKLMKLNNNNTIRNILCEIIKNINDEDKKNHIFKIITKDLNFDNNDNRNNIIDFVSKLTIACFSLGDNKNNILENDITNGNSSNDGSIYNKNIVNDNLSDCKRISINIQILKSNSLFKNKKMKKNFSRNISNNSLEKYLMNSSSYRKKNSKKKNLKTTYKKTTMKNYFGLNLLFDYIIYNYNEAKALSNKNNISKAINSFKYILDSSKTIKIPDIYYFLDKLLDNININKKYNSVVQSLNLIEILLNKLIFSNNKKSNIYNLNQNFENINFNDLDMNEEEGKIISQLDNKYDIISLITNDLVRYVSKVNKINNKKGDYKNEIFEGIYTYIKNISIRLKLIFFFVNFGLIINEENHIEKIYCLFNSEQFKDEKLLFFKELTNNIDYIRYGTLKNIFYDIFQNNKHFDKSNFEEIDTFNLIKVLFININIYKGSLIDNTKGIKVNQDLDKLEGIDFLFEILISNQNNLIRNKLCKLLSKYCLYLTNYKKEFCNKYWNNYIDKIINLMDICNKNKNIFGIIGLVQLIESIYSYNFSGKIPEKEDTHVAEEPYLLYHFCCPQRNNKIYKLRVGKIDKIIQMRWKLAYYYDICVNDLVICDKDKNEYNFVYDNENFYEIFPSRKYLFGEGKHLLINVYEYPGQLLKIPNNPKELIEKNEKIIKILIDNLSSNNSVYNNNNQNNKDDYLIKIKIWNIMKKLPKKKYIEELIKQFRESNRIEEEDLIIKFNINEIFILTFNLECILKFLHCDPDKENYKDRIKEVNDFCETFINIHHLDKIIYKNLINIDLNANLIDEKNKYIYFECFKSLLELIQILEEYKKTKTVSFLFHSTKRDKDTIQTKYENLNENNKDEDLEITKINNFYLFKDTIIEMIGNKILYKKLTDIIIIILNDSDASNDLICFNLLQEIIKFIEQLNNFYINNITINSTFQIFFEYIFENEEIFKEIFIYDFIKCSKEDVKKLLSNFLLQNLFDNYLIIKNKTKFNEANNTIKKDDTKNKYIKNYFDIILTPEIFDYLMTNQKNGSYFNLISSIIEKYINYNKKFNNIYNAFLDNDIENNNVYNENFKKIINLIINSIYDSKKINNENNICNNSLLSYPYKKKTFSNESINTNLNIKLENESLVNGILLYLLKILELSLYIEKSLVNYFLEKIDVCEFFLIKGVLNQNHEDNSKNKNLINNNSHKIIFQLVIFLLKYLDNNNAIIKGNKYLEDSLYINIWLTLNKFHKLGFLKKKTNFEINYNDSNKKEFIGLKNMSSTCYMNSILQQFFMIPMLRETILTIGEEEKNNLNQNTILYQLQLLFASLKTYDFKYYDPKHFVLVSKLSFYEQMDSDEYYCQLIDKLENDISNLYNNDKNKNIYLDLFKYFFGIKLIDELYFIDCEHKRFNESFCYNIQLEVKNYTNINDSFKNYFKIEIMAGDNKINCEQCNTKRICHKKLKIKALPNILVISLKRFDYDYRTMTKFKLNSFFEFPFELDMSEYLMNSNNNTEIENLESSINENNIYELTGITIHYGVADYGHYYDLIKAENNKWYIFNDTNIKEFPESDIPKEAFGDRENNYELDDETNYKNDIVHKDKKNAYILIYTKKNYKKIFTKNSEYKTKLIFPPYDKYSNIKENMKSIIKYKMFKYSTIENLSNIVYQNFIIELLKIDLVKNINKDIEKEHINLIRELKNDGYLPIKNYINTGNTIFSFGLLYFCNIMLKSSKDKNILKIYTDILNVYLENDINKCLYVLEEFSCKEVIEEFLISNQNFEATKIISELIILCFNNYSSNCSHENDSEHKNLNIFKFLNSIILFISQKSDSLCSNIKSLDKIVGLFCKLINKKQIFLKYLKNKGIDKWLDEIINKINNNNCKSEMNTIENNDDEDENIKMNFVLTEDNFPKLMSDHCILIEKINEYNFGFQFQKKHKYVHTNIKANSKKGKISSINSGDSIVLLRRLQDDLREIDI